MLNIHSLIKILLAYNKADLKPKFPYILENKNMFKKGSITHLRLNRIITRLQRNNFIEKLRNYSGDIQFLLETIYHLQAQLEKYEPTAKTVKASAPAPSKKATNAFSSFSNR